MTFGELLCDEKVLWSQEADRELEVLSLSCDSRTVMPGSVFFCLPGAKHDGHNFAAEAFSRGCRCFVAERMPSIPAGGSVLLCEDVRKKMALLAARYYGDPTANMTIIGVTGTKGKTTVSYMIRDLLEELGTATAYIGSLGALFDGKKFDTQNTTPDCLELFWYLRQIREAGIRIVVLELSSQALATGRAYGIPISLAVFTNISRDHIGTDEHNTMAQYRAAKLSLFTAYSPRVAVLNRKDRFSRVIAANTAAEQVVFYGTGTGAEYRGERIRYNRSGNRFYTSFMFRHGAVCRGARLTLAGSHYVDNFLAAVAAVCSITGCDPFRLLPFAERLRIPGRCEVIPVSGSGVFVVDYAHNGAALRAALRGLRPYTEGRLLCLFGAVGGRSRCRRRDMALAACRYADFSVISEDNPGEEDPLLIAKEILEAFPDKKKGICIPDREEAIRYLLREAKAGDIVLLAGKGEERYQLRREGRIPFSETDILRRFAPPART